MPTEQQRLLALNENNQAVDDPVVQSHAKNLAGLHAQDINDRAASFPMQMVHDAPLTVSALVLNDLDSPSIKHIGQSMQQFWHYARAVDSTPDSPGSGNLMGARARALYEGVGGAPLIHPEAGKSFQDQQTRAGIESSQFPIAEGAQTQLSDNPAISRELALDMQGGTLGAAVGGLGEGLGALTHYAAVPFDAIGGVTTWAQRHTQQIPVLGPVLGTTFAGLNKGFRGIGTAVGAATDLSLGSTVGLVAAALRGKNPLDYMFPELHHGGQIGTGFGNAVADLTGMKPTDPGYQGLSQFANFAGQWAVGGEIFKSIAGFRAGGRELGVPVEVTKSRYGALASMAYRMRQSISHTGDHREWVVESPIARSFADNVSKFLPTVPAEQRAGALFRRYQGKVPAPLVRALASIPDAFLNRAEVINTLIRHTQRWGEDFSRDIESEIQFQREQLAKAETPADAANAQAQISHLESQLQAKDWEPLTAAPKRNFIRKITDQFPRLGRTMTAMYDPRKIGPEWLHTPGPATLFNRLSESKMWNAVGTDKPTDWRERNVAYIKSLYDNLGVKQHIVDARTSEAISGHDLSLLVQHMADDIRPYVGPEHADELKGYLSQSLDKSEYGQVSLEEGAAAQNILESVDPDGHRHSRPWMSAQLLDRHVMMPDAYDFASSAFMRKRFLEAMRGKALGRAGVMAFYDIPHGLASVATFIAKPLIFTMRPISTATRAILEQLPRIGFDPGQRMLAETWGPNGVRAYARSIDNLREAISDKNFPEEKVIDLQKKVWEKSGYLEKPKFWGRNSAVKTLQDADASLREFAKPSAIRKGYYKGAYARKYQDPRELGLLFPQASFGRAPKVSWLYHDVQRTGLTQQEAADLYDHELAYLRVSPDMRELAARGGDVASWSDWLQNDGGKSFLRDMSQEGGPLWDHRNANPALKRFPEGLQGTVVADDHGTPTVVYHSTPVQFEGLPSMGQGRMGKGIYFSDSGDYPAYLNIKHPFDFDAPLTEETLAKIQDVARTRGFREQDMPEGFKPGDRLRSEVNDQGYYGPIRTNVTNRDLWDEINDHIDYYGGFDTNEIIKAAGFDGAKEQGGRAGGAANNHWLAFDQSQIISAFHKDVSWNPTVQDWGTKAWNRIQQIAGHDPELLHAIATQGNWALEEAGHGLDPELYSNYADLQRQLSSINENLAATKDKTARRALVDQRKTLNSEAKDIVKQLGGNIKPKSVSLDNRQGMIDNLVERSKTGEYKIDRGSKILYSNRYAQWEPGEGLGTQMSNLAKNAETILWSPLRIHSLAELKLTRGPTWNRIFLQRVRWLKAMGVPDRMAWAEAQTHASRYTSDMFYSLTSRTSFQKATRNIFWFAPLTQQFLETWAVKLPSKYYWPLGVGFLGSRVNLVVDTLQNLGVIHRDPSTGRPYVPIPGGMEFIAWLFGKTLPPELRDLKFDPLGLNMFTSGLAFGLSTPWAWALEELAKLPGPQKDMLKEVNKVLVPLSPSFGPEGATTLWELSHNGELPPWDFLSRGTQELYVKSTKEDAFRAAAEVIGPPPLISDFIRKYPDSQDPTGLSPEGERLFRRATQDWTGKVTSEAGSYYQIILAARLSGQTWFPASVTPFKEGQVLWDTFFTKNKMDELFKTDPAKFATLREQFTKQHPDLWAYTIGKSILGPNADASILRSKTYQDEFKLLAQGKRLYFDNYTDYATWIAGTETHRYLTAELQRELDKVGTNGPALLRGGFNRSLATQKYWDEWQNYLADNPAFRKMYDEQRQLWSKVEGGPAPTPFQITKISDAMHTLKGLIQRLPPGAPDLQDLKTTFAYMENVLQQYPDTYTPYGKTAQDISWYFNKVMDPYFNSLQPLYDKAQKLADSGLDSSGVYNQIRQIQHEWYQKTITYGGQTFPSPEEVTWGNRSPQDQQDQLARWATEPPEWLSPFEFEKVVGHAPSPAEWSFLSKMGDLKTQYNDANTILETNGASAKGYQLVKLAYLGEVQQAAQAAGPEAVQLAQLSQMPPFEKLAFLAPKIGLKLDTPGWQEISQSAKFVVDAFAQAGRSYTSDQSKADIAVKGLFFQQIDRLSGWNPETQTWDKSQAQDPGLADLLTELSVPFASGTDPVILGHNLYDRLFFDNWQGVSRALAR